MAIPVHAKKLRPPAAEFALWAVWRALHWTAAAAVGRAVARPARWAGRQLRHAQRAAARVAARAAEWVEPVVSPFLGPFLDTVHRRLRHRFPVIVVCVLMAANLSWLAYR